MAAGCVLLAAALLSLTLTLAHDHDGDTETYFVSVGKLFLLRCPISAHAEVTWSRGHNLSLPAGVEVRDGMLWFLPVQMSHNGSYTCKKRDKTELPGIKLGVSVSSEECPDSSETVSIKQDVNGGLNCKQEEIMGLNNTRNIRWMKDCRPVERQGEPIDVEDNGFMRLPAALGRDAGKYTCLIDIDLNGRKYTAARSMQLKISDDPVLTRPTVVFPQQDVIQVELGMRVELKCLAYIGISEDYETLMYWTVNGTFSEEDKDLDESWNFTHKDGRVYALSILSISKVSRWFLDVPITCHLISLDGMEVGTLWLQEADHSDLYISVSLCLAASLVVLTLMAGFLFFRVDLVLTYRKLLRHFTKQQAPDGKLYDAYVSFLHPDPLSSAETASFALKILPGELESKHGYSLYIRGRDDCPGEAVHDSIASTVSQCRRLIIILSCVTTSSADGKTEEALLHNNQLSYEHEVGLHDALTQNSPRVILVEIGGPVDYSVLPESLRYIKRKQGVLKWKKPSLKSHKLTKLWSNMNFWKKLRYHMPPVPAGRLQTFV